MLPPPLSLSFTFFLSFLPQLEPEPEEPKSDVFPEDAGDVLRRSEEERAAAEAAEFARRSTALKREPALPRPLVVDEEAIESVVEETGDAALGEALIREEIARLLRHDLAKYPVRIVAALGVAAGSWFPRSTLGRGHGHPTHPPPFFFF